MLLISLSDCFKTSVSSPEELAELAKSCLAVLLQSIVTQSGWPPDCRGKSRSRLNEVLKKTICGVGFKDPTAATISQIYRTDIHAAKARNQR